MIPTGNCSCWKIVLAIVSAITRNAAPMMALAGRSCRWSGPKIRRTPCGIISPINPISPLRLTAMAVIKAESAKATVLTLLISTPRFCASCSPRLRAFNLWQIVSRPISPPIMQTAAMMRTGQSFGCYVAHQPVNCGSKFVAFCYRCKEHNDGGKKGVDDDAGQQQTRYLPFAGESADQPDQPDRAERACECEKADW